MFKTAEKSERIRKGDIKRSTSESELNEHHRNYLKFNRSDIFQNDKINHKEETSIERMRKDLKSSNLKELMQKFKLDYAVKRKFKYGFLKKQFYIEPEKLGALTPKERKIKELYPKLANSEIRSIIQTTIPTNVTNEPKCDETFSYLPNKTNSFASPKKLKLENMIKSNVFGESSLKKLEVSTPNGKTSPNRFFLHSTNLDWKKVNTEIMFSGDIKKERIVENKYHPTKMKMRELDSHLGANEKDYNQVDIKKRSVDFRQSQLNEISQNFSSHIGKVKESVSALHPEEFYLKASQADKDKVRVVPYEIYNVKDITNFSVKELTGMIAKNGLHVYDVHVENQLGKDEGNVRFKVRTANEKKLKSIEDKMMNAGLKCQRNSDSRRGNCGKSMTLQKRLTYDNNYKNMSSIDNFKKNDICFIEKLKSPK